MSRQSKADERPERPGPEERAGRLAEIVENLVALMPRYVAAVLAGDRAREQEYGREIQDARAEAEYLR